MFPSGKNNRRQTFPTFSALRDQHESPRLTLGFDLAHDLIDSFLNNIGHEYNLHPLPQVAKASLLLTRTGLPSQSGSFL